MNENLNTYLREGQNSVETILFWDKIDIYIADDSAMVRKKLTKELSEFNCKISAYKNIPELEQAIGENKPDLLLLDIYFEQEDSFNVLEKYSKSFPIIAISASRISEDIDKVYLCGAIDFMQKPINKTLLKRKIDYYFNRTYMYKSQESIWRFINALLYTAEIRDYYTRGHSDRVAEYATKIALRLKLKDEMVENIKIGALLHDIGKIGVKDLILLKKESLTEEEFKEIQQHSIYGYNICCGLESFKPFLGIIRNHHEKIDGSGYPDGLKGAEIPIEVQIVSIADVYDALVSKRIYRNAMDKESAFKIMFDEAKSGKWDWNLIVVLKEVMDGSNELNGG